MVRPLAVVANAQSLSMGLVPLLITFSRTDAARQRQSKQRNSFAPIMQPMRWLLL